MQPIFAIVGRCHTPLLVGSRKELFSKVLTSKPHVGVAVRLIFLLYITSTLAFAQTSSFGQAAQGIATEMIGIAKWVGIILCIVCGFGLMTGGGHGAGTLGKVSGLVIGLVFALFAAPIVSWIQAL